MGIAPDCAVARALALDKLGQKIERNSGVFRGYSKYKSAATFLVGPTMRLAARFRFE